MDYIPKSIGSDLGRREGTQVFGPKVCKHISAEALKPICCYGMELHLVKQ
ncbi:Hypothetical protein FKW44_001168 [Caligus rogercresseyi]|uniref:Uncharacterized protein n=1 Tax=Caligus rogercresseyi TaxID=217165 RepID=A0A7T8KIE8_CALRO|nr:Hypothetical protein FKW44_001168 [Caligus rogercresseyi]